MMEFLYQIAGTIIVWIFMIGVGCFGMVYGWEKIAIHIRLYKERKELADFLLHKGLVHEFRRWSDEHT